eukprot:scaffold104189_cov53-Attheya_sp.AAC.3
MSCTASQAPSTRHPWAMHDASWPWVDIRACSQSHVSIMGTYHIAYTLDLPSILVQRSHERQIGTYRYITACCG